MPVEVSKRAREHKTTMNNLPSCAVNAHLHQFDKISGSHIHKPRKNK